jgi:hypothetical protein
MSNLSDETEKQERALETAAREYGKHSGPASDESERRTFARDLRMTALRFARAYYAEARELGLIPETWLAPGHPRQMWRGNVEGACLECGASYGAHDVDDNCPKFEPRQ